MIWVLSLSHVRNSDSLAGILNPCSAIRPPHLVMISAEQFSKVDLGETVFFSIVVCLSSAAERIAASQPVKVTLYLKGRGAGNTQVPLL